MYVRLQIFFICFLLLTNLSVFSQTNYVKPMDTRALLSGSFGELRATHFHTGIDLRTEGRTGLTVRSIKDGLLVRIKISPFGYGYALYIAHNDGTTSVYAHLDRFAPQIAKIAKDIQYQKESFSIDENVSSYHIRFKSGEIIGYSGNSGSSGGPHLHFEIRETDTEKPINPLKSIKVTDNITPVIKGIHIYTITDGHIERYAQVPLMPSGIKYSCIQVPEGQIGIGLFLTDGMNDTFSRLGIYELNMDVDSSAHFHYTADKLNFANAKYINEFKDYWLYRDFKQTVYRMFGHHISILDGVALKNNGFIEIKEGEKRMVNIQVKDYHGNCAKINLEFMGTAPIERGNHSFLNYALPHSFHCGHYSFNMPQDALTHSIEPICYIDSLSDCQEIRRETFFVSLEEEPLVRSAKVRYDGDFDPQSLICSVNSKKQLCPLNTKRDSASLYATTYTLGRFTIAKDSITPSINYLGLSGGQLRFKVKDDFSGISTFRGEVNGKWCLFEYDAKSNLIFCRRTEKAFRRGTQNVVVLRVEDAVGNVTEKKINYTYK